MPKKKEEENEIVEKEVKEEKKTKKNEDLSFNYLTTSILTGLIIICSLIKTNMISMAAIVLSAVQGEAPAEERIIEATRAMAHSVLNYSFVMMFILVLSMGLTWFFIKKKNKKALYIQIGVLLLILAFSLLKVLEVFA